MQIAKRMSDIARREGLAMTDATLDALIEGANADIRLILGQLQVLGGEVGCTPDACNALC